MGMNYRGSGRGKLLLFGEHAAVKGYPALGLALDRGIEVELLPEEDSARWILEGYDERENAVAREVMKRIGEAVPGFPGGGRIRVASDLPEGRGYGSSAALCAALAEAALRASGTPEAVRHRSLVWGIAHHAEGVFHGTPSGIDTGLAVLGGLIAFAPKPPDLPDWHRVPHRTIDLVVGSLPRRDSAKALIAGVGTRASFPGSREAGILARLGELSVEAERLFSLAGPDEARTAAAGGAPNGFAASLGSLARQAEAGLSELGLVDEGVAALLAAGEVAGATGGKMSGAGGGGAFWLACSEGKTVEKVTESLEARARELGLATELELGRLRLAPDRTRAP